MKAKFSLQKKEASVEADIEGVVGNIVEKVFDFKSKHPEKKTRYQIRQEEKRKNAEHKHKQQMQYLYILLACIAVGIVIGIIGSLLGI